VPDGAAGVVAEHAVVEHQAAGPQPAGVGGDARPHHDGVDDELGAVGQHGPPDGAPPVALQRAQGGRRAHVDAGAAQQVGDDPAAGRAERAAEQDVALLHHRDRAPAAARGGGDLGAHEAAAQHQQPPRAVEHLAQRQRVGQGGERADAVQRGARPRPGPRPHALGQRRAVVRGAGLVADDRQRAVEPELAQLLRGVQAGEPGPDDDVPQRGGAHGGGPASGPSAE
jgi:hypothetical protein